ncbi:MAG: tripartite tricarboxylate transporter TctB family protein [Methylibium sp.]|uniref:tripartite tricarboxylate transporter TctB family protein n=1 Tax=Methylibium sp. TaxID=2067992 RepID=UPI0017E282D2|nr:tripartite tricarboxylate transporter TctB family protein [Methylibium sp.]MBA3596333.1 tripartite tricarboxylate transporter TctB family protein [Methylibium sp.]
MAHDEEASGEIRRGVATNVVEAVVAAIVLVVGLVVVIQSRALGAGWTTDGPGSGYFPFYVGLIVAISAAFVLYQAVFGKNRNTEIFVDTKQLKLVLSVLVPAMVYVLVVQFLGLYVASAIYIALFMIVMGKYSWVKSVIAAVAINTWFFLMFEVWFKVPLFKGALGPLDFLGY